MSAGCWCSFGRHCASVSVSSEERSSDSDRVGGAACSQLWREDDDLPEHLVTAKRRKVATVLPRDAMLAPYLLSSCHSCVRLSVCHKPVFYKNDYTCRRIEPVVIMEASFELLITGP